MDICLYEDLSVEELYTIDGGKTVSDWLLFGSSICLCFVQPQIGVPATVLVFALT